MADLADARAKAEEALAEARKAVNRWVVDDRRVPKADLVGYLVLLADLTEPLLASPPAAPARDEVREAAEVIRTILTAHDARLSESGVLTYGPPSKGTGFVAAIQWLRRYDAARGGE